MKNKTKHRRKPVAPPARPKSEFSHMQKLRKPISVRSRFGLSHPVRGSLGRALADELADR
jgi:hypothetical protein